MQMQVNQVISLGRPWDLQQERTCHLECLGLVEAEKLSQEIHELIQLHDCLVAGRGKVLDHHASHARIPQVGDPVCLQSLADRLGHLRAETIRCWLLFYSQVIGGHPRVCLQGFQALDEGDSRDHGLG